MKAQRIGWMSIALAVMVASCFAEPPSAGPNGAAQGGRGGTMTSMPTAGSMNDGGAPPAMGNQICEAPKASEKLPARANVVSDDALPPEQEIFVSALADEFKAECGACHYDAALGGFNFTKTNFFQKVGQDAVDRMKSDDPTKFMPPGNSGGVPYSSRHNDSITQLVSKLETWIAAGRPADVYFVKNDVTERPYQFTGELGSGLTNLGSCVPDTAFAFGSAQDDMDELDALFEAAEQVAPSMTEIVLPEEQLGLPLLLKDTDLKTFDSAVLARSGVVAFVPAYPLWTDGAGKLRHVRVPRGKSIVFNKETQEFDIPPNTRFYKTFFKDVIDRDGNPTWRKMETRIIVARPDKVENGVRVPQSLFGTYQWDPEETQAKLVTDSQRNGVPFKDVLVTYTPDEPKAQAIRDTMPLNLTYELEYEGALRRYAIPGRERCVQCHMGSHNSSFVLGFSPVQIRRRPTDEGGTYEPTGDDELSQLERLMAYGVITGVDSVDDIKLLEDVQGDRKPRNDYELKAQGYMLGNCAHCHNPNGYPSQVAPELKEVLKFWPDSGGGVFQFPLEQYSPRIFRGPSSTQIAYITPSLYDVWALNWRDQTYWTPKVLEDTRSGAIIPQWFYAPWRSLIYRNTQTPFTYADSYTLYPHMPMNTAGFDCRAQQIFGDWMVSIPSVRKHPEQREDFFPVAGLNPIFTDPTTVGYEVPKTDFDPQPYVEVLPGDKGYAEAQAAAAKRLERFHSSQQYQTCIMSKDIVDPIVYRGGDRDAPIDTSQPPDGVPDLPHWVSTDLTERAGPWSPRRDDWQEQLLTAEPKEGDLVTPLLRHDDVRLSEGGLDTFLKTPLPMAKWKNKDGCDFGSQPKASSFQGDSRPRWLNISNVADDERIFSELPGQAIFDMICVNCHGRPADSRGRQAETVQALSGGETRVANLRDGLFGPPGSPGTNLQNVFSPVASGDTSSRDWAARYMSWMALGGTQRVIPKVVLGQVARTEVSGTERELPLLSDVDANMLASARQACRLVIPVLSDNVSVGGGFSQFAIRPSQTALIEENGDAELWQRVCSFGNAPIVRVITFLHESTNAVAIFAPTHYRGDAYPANTLIGDHLGHFKPTLDPKTNFFPWCLDTETEPAKAASYMADNAKFFPNGVAPKCPPGFVSFGNKLEKEDEEVWATRGAINAGFSVFVFLEAMTKGQLVVDGTSKPFSPIRYDECQLLSAP
jgi:mono/diheme cytochrome c family protein